jgi:hypothetical protein
MAQRIIAENVGVQDVTYSLPNKHYIPVDMRYIGLDNLTPCVPSQFFFCIPPFAFFPFLASRSHPFWVLGALGPGWPISRSNLLLHYLCLFGLGLCLRKYPVVDLPSGLLQLVIRITFVSVLCGLVGAWVLPAVFLSNSSLPPSASMSSQSGRFTLLLALYLLSDGSNA